MFLKVAMDKIEVSELTLSRLLNWIKASESRLSFIFSISTAMLAVLAVLVKSENSFEYWTLIITTITALMILLSVIFSAFATLPRTDGPAGSLIYFGGITDKSKKVYIEEFKEMDKEVYLNDLISQCYRNAEIAEIKFKWFQRSMWCLFLSVLPWLVSVYLLYS